MVYAEKLNGRRIMFACETECTCISTEDGVTVSAHPVNELFTSQEEAEHSNDLTLTYML